MSPNLSPDRSSLNGGLPGARHSKRRYPVEFDLRYKLVAGDGTIERGLGRSREFSDGKVTFSADRPMVVGTELTLSLNWPLRIGGICPLQLVISGRVVGSNGGDSTVRIGRYEFRTRSSQSMAPREAVSRSGFQIHAGTTAIDARRG